MTMVQVEATDFTPPPRPPPLLSDRQILQLAQEGSLPLALPSHNIASVCAQLSAATSSFMAKASSEKQALYPPAQGTELGYVGIAAEKEYITLRARLHPDSALEQLAAHAWRDIAALLHRVLVDLAVALALPDPVAAWTPLLDGCLALPAALAQATPSLMRLFRYLPTTGVAERHADLGLLTLCVGSGAGLQCLAARHGTWHDASGPTLLVGHTLQALSRGRIRAGVHRVVGNPAGRTSVVFALRPSLRHERLEMALFGMPEAGTLSIRELWDEIKGRKVNINASVEAREKQRRRNEERAKMMHAPLG